VADYGSGPLQMAMLARDDLTVRMLERIAEGPNIRASETAAAKLMLFTGKDVS
jgi:hypothetical protein